MVQIMNEQEEKKREWLWDRDGGGQLTEHQDGNQKGKLQRHCGLVFLQFTDTWLLG